jgi:hypothetical protein
MVLVCHGDDRPDQFADWLKTLVADFESLFSIACEFGIDLDPQDGSAPIVDVMDFCQRLGIEFRSNMWEGSLISALDGSRRGRFDPHQHTGGECSAR